MHRALFRPALALLLPLASTPLAAAQDVTPTHTFETPMVFPPFAGSVTFATMIAPPGGENVWKTELHIDWITDGTQSAALFGMQSKTSLESGPTGTWVVTGADLGWGPAAGTWSAVTATDLFDGTLASGPFGFPPVLDVVFEAAGGGGLWGQIGPASKIVFYLGPRAQVDVPSISLSAGGAQTLALSAGPTVGPGKIYLVAGSLTGTTPGFDVGGAHVPLVLDAYTILTVNDASSGPFVDTLGFLDAAGTATAKIALPAGTTPSLAGLDLHHAMILVDPLQGVLSASNPVDLALLP